MRFILLLLLTTSFTYAKSKESCYSVQLTSFVYKNNSEYSFEKQGYPQSCKLISFTNMNAVRCGCFDAYKNAKDQARVLKDEYQDAKVVTTYRYRFAPTHSQASKKQVIYSAPIIETTLDVETNTPEKQLSLILTPKEAITSSKIAIIKEIEEELKKKR